MKPTYRLLPPQLLAESQETLVRFVRQEGDRRITKQAMEWLEKLTPKLLQSQETRVVLAMRGKQVIGLFAISRYGLHHSLLVVDKRYRHRGIGKGLTQYACALFPKLYVRIALDNEASLALFQGLGFELVKASIGPTGKPTLWLAFGKWTPDDLQKHAG
ncbi:hypothetical protein T458_09475 [Brevibacillus panacihumi W25]|uniref:N-acetyltransferase domain-containing protein n=1 Tax=Brevibacillus panacihumi W25 TaxID=1408254 RepID=V6M932_9BACL|nr:GNAT family N-acetyltransferase [Brevibacillus panacihumi]EST55061.1 hypothetical protein T458_09475 [Brevibacillus panacihumi W25]